jgi:hypothetical protein
MIKGQVANILKLAEKFEQKNKSSKPKIEIDYTLEMKLSRLLGKNISSKNIQNWVEKNLAQLKSFIAYPGMVLPSGVIRYNVNYKHNGNTTWVIISNTPKLFDNYQIIASSLLSGEENIPNLWLHLVMQAGSTQSESIITPELAHNDYILLSFQSMFGNSKIGINDKIIGAAQSFYATNKDKINNIRKYFKERPKLIGEGVDGAVFSIGPDLILKTFKDDFAYRQAQETIKRLHDFPELAKTESMIYDVGMLGDYQGKLIYYYIMEKMKPVNTLAPTASTNISKIASAIGDYIYMRSKEGKLLKIKSNIDEYMKSKSSRETLLEELGAMNKFIERFIRIKYANEVQAVNIELKDKLNENWLSSLIEEISIKYLTSRGDLGPHNLGLTNFGLLRYFDPTTYDWKTGLNLGEKYKADKDQL